MAKKIEDHAREDFESWASTLRVGYTFDRHFDGPYKNAATQDLWEIFNAGYRYGVIYGLNI